MLFGSVLFGLSADYREETGGAVSLEQTIGARINDFVNQSGSSELIATLSLAAFWAGVGSLVYLVITIIGNLFQSQIDDFGEARDFVRPGIVNPSQKWAALAERGLIRASSILALCGLIVGTIYITAPLMIRTFDLFTSNLTNLESILGGFIAVLIVMFHLHLVVVLLRIASLRTRLFVANN